MTESAPTAARSILWTPVVPYGTWPTTFMAAEPLIHWPFCPDKVLLAGFSGRFAQGPLSAISGHHPGGIVCLSGREINNPHSPQNRSLPHTSSSIAETCPFARL
jgi:hypothetical protein